jgi:hypothetical protein
MPINSSVISRILRTHNQPQSKQSMFAPKEATQGKSAPGQFTSMKAQDYCAHAPSVYRQAVISATAAVGANSHQKGAAGAGASGGSTVRKSDPGQYVSLARSTYCRHPESEYQHTRAQGDQNTHRDIGDVRHVGKEHFVSMKQQDYQRWEPSEYRKQLGVANTGEFKARHVDKEHFTSESRFTYRAFPPDKYKEALHPGGSRDLSGVVDAAKHTYRPRQTNTDQYVSLSRSTYAPIPTEEYLAKKADLAATHQPYVVRRVGEEHFTTLKQQDYQDFSDNAPPQK